MTLALLLACSAPDVAALFGDVQTFVEPDGEAADRHLIDAIDAATTELSVALPSSENVDLADAIVAAWDRGVAVEVVTDVDVADDPGIAAISDALIPLRLADGGLTYFDFAINVDVTWTSEQVRMSHAWAIVDHERIVGATSAGSLASGPRVVLDTRGEDLVEDFLLEFNQVFGGTDATALTSFSNPAKSVVDARWIYGTTDDTTLGVWFGPQERLVKRVIDAVYGARSSVRILTDDLSNDGLVRALQAKAANGFPVTVIVGPRFGTASSAQARALENEAPDVERFRVTDEDTLPTVLLVDLESTRLGQRNPAVAMILTHDLVSSARVWTGTEVESDQLIDGTLWSLTDTDDYRTGPSGGREGQDGGPHQALLDLFETQLDRAEPL